MKKIIFLILTCLLILGLCACNDSEDGGAKYEGLQVGFSRQSITPTQVGARLAGGDSTGRLSTGFTDEVTATCIAIQKGEELVLVYTLDFMVLYNNTVSAIKPGLATAIGVSEDQIVLNCTHTHSGININTTNWDGAEAYRVFFIERAAKAAKEAMADLSPAAIEIASCETEGLAFVRHYLMSDGSTSGNGHGGSGSIQEHLYEAANELQAIKFTRAAEDKKDILMLSFPAHATTAGGLNPNLISACWPGFTRTYVEQNSEYHCAIFQGASGDQVPDSKIPGISAAKKDLKKYSQVLGDYALGLEFTAVEGDQVVFKTWDYTGNSMKEGLEDPTNLAHAQEITALASQKGSGDGAVGELCAKYGFFNYYEASGLVSRNSFPETRTMSLKVLQLGSDCAMVFAPYEMFGMHGDGIKEGSDFAMDFIVTCSENYSGYIPHLQGCEESFYEYDVTYYERGTGEKLVEVYSQTLNELKNAS